MDIPFVTLFRTPNAYYFYEVNKSEFVQIGELSFRYLHELIINKSDITDSMPQELIDLKDSGYLATKSVVEEIQHFCSDFIDVFLDRKLDKITLQLTQDCNFRCKYCVYSENRNARQRRHSEKRMDWETAKKALDFFWDHSVDTAEVNIGFYGGEPLLEFPLIKQVVEYSKRRFSGKNLSFNITTNATLLTDEMIYYFRNHKVSVLISLDGPKEINDKNRVFSDGSGTFDAVLERISRIKEIAPEFADMVTINMTLDPENDYDCINSIQLENEELQTLNMQSFLVDFDYDDEPVKFSDEYAWKNEYHNFLAALHYLNRFPKEDISPIAEKNISRAFHDAVLIGNTSHLYKIDAPSGPCLPGQMRLFVDAYGKFFPCERISETSAVMCIGSLENGFNLDNVHKLLNIGRVAEDICKNCWCFRYCGLCAKKGDDGSEELSEKVKLFWCEGTRASAYEKCRRYLLLTEIPVFYQNQARNICKEGIDVI